MDPTDLSDDQLDQLAQQLAGRLPTGTHGDRVVLSRRQFAAAATGTLGAGALMALGVDEASAQAAGQQGTASSPNDMFAYNLDVQNGAEFNGTDIENAGSLSTTGSITINNSILFSESYVLNDDEATDTGLDKSQTAFIFLHGLRDGEVGAYGVGFSILYTMIEGDGFDSSSSGNVLTGTTGTDGVINISVTGGDIYLENRSGEQQTIRLFSFDLRD